MAQFYATIKGARGEASRLGNRQSGMQVSVMSYQGVVSVYMRTDPKTGDDHVGVYLKPHSNSSSAGPTVCLYQGPCSGWEDYQGLGELGRMIWHREHGRWGEAA